MTPYEARQQAKADAEAYREAAGARYPEAYVADHSDVQQDAGKTGAFVTITVWIPRSAITKSRQRRRAS